MLKDLKISFGNNYMGGSPIIKLREGASTYYLRQCQARWMSVTRESSTRGNDITRDLVVAKK